MAAGIRCAVVAPALIPVKPGERIKTDRRDARKLATYLKAGPLTEVRPPTEEEEGVRDLCRCREDVREDLMCARHRLGKLLLRRGLIFDGKAWTQKHRAWLRGLRFERQADKTVFDHYLEIIEMFEERQRGLDHQLELTAAKPPYAERVAWLRCYRGIDTVTAMSIVAELHGVARFQSARGLMSYLGLVPSEHSSGEKRSRGALTKAGNGHLWRLLIESAWHYRHRPGIGAALRKRQAGQPGWIVGMANRAQIRLHRRYWKLVSATKPHNKAVAAVARELTGFVWATLCRPGIADIREQSQAVRSRRPPATAADILAEARRSGAPRSRGTRAVSEHAKVERANRAVSPRAKVGRGRPAGPALRPSERTQQGRKTVSRQA